ncbi:MAG: hypothetical protein AAFW47_08590 [Pseudomonadota bacterium]
MKKTVATLVAGALVTSLMATPAFSRGGSALGAGEDFGLTLAEINQRDKLRQKKNNRETGSTFSGFGKKKQKNNRKSK